MAPKRQPEAVVETPPRALEAVARDVFALLVRDMGAAKAKALWRSIAAKPGPHKNPEKAALQAEYAKAIEEHKNNYPNEQHKIIPTLAKIMTEEKHGKRSIRNKTAYSKALEANEKRLRRWMEKRKAELAAKNKALAAALDRYLPKRGGLYGLDAAALAELAELAEKKDTNPP
jgi:hypothetical protein